MNREPTVDDKARALAAQQFGVVTVAQLRRLGMTRGLLRIRRARGDWLSVAPQVLAAAGSPDTIDQRRSVAVLRVGENACLSHQSAAAFWGMPGFVDEPFHVTSGRSGHRRLGDLVVHEPRLMAPHHHLSRNRIPVTTPTRTAFDLAAVVHPARLARVVDTMWARRLVSGETLHGMFAELARSGRNGVTNMRTVLADRPRHYRPPESGLESRFAAILSDAGITGFERQVDVGDDFWIGRVDFINRAWGVIIEIQSHAFHGSVLDRSHDQQRLRRLRAAGFTVGEVTEHEVWHRPRDVVQKVRDLCSGAQSGSIRAGLRARTGGGRG